MISKSVPLYRQIRECWFALATLPNGPERTSRLHQWQALADYCHTTYGLTATTQIFQAALQEKKG
jgi:hypothetical protein